MKSRFGRPLAYAAALVLTVIVGPVSQVSAAAADTTTTPYVGTLIQQRADSQIMKHTDGYYYFTGTVPEYDRIVLRRAKTLAGLASAPETVIWRRHATGEMPTTSGRPSCTSSTASGTSTSPPVAPPIVGHPDVRPGRHR